MEIKDLRKAEKGMKNVEKAEEEKKCSKARRTPANLNKRKITMFKQESLSSRRPM